MIYTLRQGTNFAWLEQILARTKYLIIGLASVLLLVWVGELFIAGSRHVSNPPSGSGDKALNVSSPQPGHTTAASSSNSTATTLPTGTSTPVNTSSNGTFFGSGSSATGTTGSISNSLPSSGSTGTTTGGMGGGSTGGGATSGGGGGGGGGSGGSVIVTIPGTCVDALGKPLVCTGTTTIDP
jgi:hypothetical protein